MSISEADIRTFIQSRFKNIPEDTLNSLSRGVHNVLISNAPPVLPPNPTDSIVITMSKPKVAALSYDKILLAPHLVPQNIPDGIFFHTGTRAEMINIMWYFVSDAIESILGIQHSYDIAATSSNFNQNLRIIGNEIGERHSCTPAIIFNSNCSYEAEFPTGPQQVLTAALEHIALVDEDSLTWEQVLEFRKDTEARAKYKRLVRWIDEELKTKSPEAVQDLIAIRLDDYEWSVKKHGMKTKLGALSCVLDPKFLVAASTVVGASSLAGGELWAALSGAAVTIGGALVSFGQARIDSLDERRKENYEVAYIHDIKKKTT